MSIVFPKDVPMLSQTVMLRGNIPLTVRVVRANPADISADATIRFKKVSTDEEAAADGVLRAADEKSAYIGLYAKDWFLLPHMCIGGPVSRHVFSEVKDSFIKCLEAAAGDGCRSVVVRNEFNLNQFLITALAHPNNGRYNEPRRFDMLLEGAALYADKIMSGQAAIEDIVIPASAEAFAEMKENPLLFDNLVNNRWLPKATPVISAENSKSASTPESVLLRDITLWLPTIVGDSASRKEVMRKAIISLLAIYGAQEVDSIDNLDMRFRDDGWETLMGREYADKDVYLSLREIGTMLDIIKLGDSTGAHRRAITAVKDRIRVLTAPTV